MACLAAPATAGDYPYIRAYAIVANWTKIEFEDKLRLARVNKVPQTAVYPEAREYHGWRLLGKPGERQVPPGHHRACGEAEDSLGSAMAGQEMT